MLVAGRVDCGIMGKGKAGIGSDPWQRLLQREDAQEASPLWNRVNDSVG